MCLLHAGWVVQARVVICDKTHSTQALCSEIQEFWVLVPIPFWTWIQLERKWFAFSKSSNLKMGKERPVFYRGERPIRVFNTFSSLEIVPAQVKLLIKWHLCLYRCCPHNINAKCPLILIASKKTAFVCSEKEREINPPVHWLITYVFQWHLITMVPGHSDPSNKLRTRTSNPQLCLTRPVWILGHESFECVAFV